MNIPIYYNETTDEFTNDLTLQMRVENYINKHFYPAYIISQIAPVYLLGGSIRDLIFAKPPKDLDFVVMGKQNKDFVLKVFDRLNIEYRFNKFGGFKFNYNDVEVDLWLTDDLFSSIEYNVDGLFYDVNNKSLISFTFDDFLTNGLRLINDSNNKPSEERKKKLMKFQKELIK